MKRLIVLLTVVSFLLISAVPSGAISLELGDFGMKLRDVTYFDVPAGQPGAPTPAPGGIGSGNLWGIASITSIHGLLAGDIEIPLLAASYWNEGDGGQYLQAVYGGLTLNRTVDAGGSPAIGFPYDSYFQDDLSTAELAYMKVYLLNNNAMDNVDYAAGPNALVGQGASGTFGAGIMSGQLWLDMVFAPGILLAYDPMALPADLEHVKNAGILAGSGTLYANIVGGIAAPLFQTGQFPLYPPVSPWPWSADIKMQTDITFLYNPITGVWTDPAGWTAVSEDPVTGTVVPEPASMILLGSGLIGLAGLARKRRKKPGKHS